LSVCISFFVLLYSDIETKHVARQPGNPYIY